VSVLVEVRKLSQDFAVLTEEGVDLGISVNSDLVSH